MILLFCILLATGCLEGTKEDVNIKGPIIDAIEGGSQKKIIKVIKKYR